MVARLQISFISKHVLTILLQFFHELICKLLALQMKILGVIWYSFHIGLSP